MSRQPLEARYIGTGTFFATERARELIHGVLDSGRISYGPISKQFEQKFAELHDSRYAILSNSGTSSLHVALQTLKTIHGWADGAEVLVPAVTFVATVNVVLHNNLTPIFVDIGLSDFGMDPKNAVNAWTDRTVAMIPVHLFGQPCNMPELMDFAWNAELSVIEDSCEAMFVKCSGKLVGSMGDIGCFSTYNAHIISTGVGGIATTSNSEYAQMMRSLVNHGLEISELNTDQNFSPAPAIGRNFRFAYPGHSYRITELEAALGLAQLEEHSLILRMRRRNAKHLTAGLARINSDHRGRLRLPYENAGRGHAWMMYPILSEQKPELTGWLNECQIETRDLMPITNQPIFQKMLDPNDYPVAEIVNQNGFYIGCHQDLSPEDIEYVLQSFQQFFDR